MFRRLAQRALSSYVGGPGRSWMITTGAALLYRLVRSNVGRRELVDVSDIKPGEMIVIEHLPVSHKAQIKQEKKDKRANKRARRRSRRSGNAD